MADYTTLATVSNPGQSPFHAPGMTPSLTDTIDYIQKQKMNDTAMKGVQSLAELDLQKQQQANQEYMAGSSGRLDTIDTGNQMAAAAKQMAPGEIANKLLEQRNKHTEDENREIDLKLKPLDSAANAYMYAKNRGEDPTAAYQASLAQLQGTKIGPHVFGSDPKMDQALLEYNFNARRGNPAFDLKEDIANIGADAKTAVAKEATKRGITIEEMRDRTRLEVQQLTAQAAASRAAGKPLTPDQDFVLSIKDLNLSPHQKAEVYLAHKGANGLMTGRANAQTASDIGIPVTSPTPEGIIPPGNTAPVTAPAQQVNPVNVVPPVTPLTAGDKEYIRKVAKVGTPMTLPGPDGKPVTGNIQGVHKNEKGEIDQIRINGVVIGL